MRSECKECHRKTINKLIDKFQPGYDKSKLFREKVVSLYNKKYSNPYLAGRVHNLAKDIFNCADLYAIEKNNANTLLLSNYTFWKKLVEQSDNPFYTAAKLAVAGNIIDYGAHTVPEDIEQQVKKLINTPLSIDHSLRLLNAIKNAESILYLTDNAGEIVFDRLFIETIRHPNITLGIRGDAIINDATIDDIKQVGLDKLCKVIPNGYDAPSTLLEYCSTEFVTVFKKADLIISKGMGNFEGLMHTNQTTICFMLMAKCEPMAQLLRVTKGDQVIKMNG